MICEDHNITGAGRGQGNWAESVGIKLGMSKVAGS